MLNFLFCKLVNFFLFLYYLFHYKMAQFAQCWNGEKYYEQAASFEVSNKLPQTLEFDKYQNIIDIGCGPGNITAWIAGQTNGEVVGIDASESMINYANKHYGNINNLSFQHISAQNISGNYDLVFSCNVFHWISYNDQELILNKFSNNDLVIMTEFQTTDHHPIINAFYEMAKLPTWDHCSH